jgi:serine/threonine protein kinase
MLTNKLTSLGDSFTTTLGDATAIQQRQTRDTTASLTAPSRDDRPQLFFERYNIGAEMGKGSFLGVHEAVNMQSTEEVMVKVVDRRELHPADAVALQDEIVALRELVGCPHIVELFEVFEEPDTTFLVMEKMRGGDLIERIISKAHYTEADAKQVCKNILLGVQYCHSKSIANRNIKPENLLLSEMGNNVDVKLSDFGYAKKVLYPNSLRTQCGTEGYTAPEILEHRPEYDVPCDLWSLGVVMYILVRPRNVCLHS